LRGRYPPPAANAADLPADCTHVDFHETNPSVLAKIFNHVSITLKVRIQDLTPQLDCSNGLGEGRAVTS